MKRMLSAALAAMVCFLVACSSKDAGDHKMSATAQKNLDASHAITKMFETKDFSKLGDYIATDAVDHAGPTGDVVGVDSIKAELVEMCKTMTDMKSEVVKELADDDYVFSWTKTTATMTAPGMGMPAGTYTTNGLEVSKFKDGKATEHWTFMMPGEMMKMMAPQSAPMMEHPATDTTKKM